MQHDLEGQKINQFRIIRLLGKGGMGSVFQALDEDLNRPVAIKIIHPSLMNEPQFQSRFMQEAQTAANLDHPSIIRIFNFNREGGWLYMVMELVSKGSLIGYLQEWQRKGQHMPLDEVLHLVAQTADALGYAHQRGIVHRDIKPDNVLLKELEQPDRAGEPRLRAVVTDFGLVKLKEGGLLQTEASLLLGTLPYISPEQLEGKKPDGRTDLYSLGIVLYELVTGQLPYDIRTVDEAFKQHRGGQPTPPHHIRPEVPVTVADIISKAMAKEPARRFQSGAEMAAALRTARQSWQSHDMTQMAALPETPPIPVVAAAPAPMPVPAPAPPPPDQLLISREGESDRSHPLLKPTLTIGRTNVNDIVLNESSVSSRHARLEKSGPGWQVVDLQSTNGTFLAGVELMPNVPVPWPVGEKLMVGPFTLIWQTAVVPAAAKIAPAVVAGAVAAASFQPPPPADRPVIIQPAPPPPTARESSFAATPELSHLSSIRLEPMTISLKPGSQTVVQAYMYNESVRVDHFSVEIEGLPRDWVRMAESSVQLMPNKETTFRFTIHAPVEGTRAQTYPYRLILRSSSDQRIEGHAFGNLLVEPAPRFAASLNPVRVKNSGSTQVIIQNTGNTEERYTVLAQDGHEAVLFDQMACRVTVPPGQEERVNFKVRPVLRPYYGSSKKSHPFQFQVLPAMGEPKTQAGQLEVSPRLPKWIVLFFIAIFGVSIPFGMFSVNGIKSRAVVSISGTATAFAVRTQEVVVAEEVTRATATALSAVQAETATAVATINYGLQDNDKDGLSNAEEAEFGTNPDKADTDEDGLNDGEEINSDGVRLLNTDPLNPDTDNDGLLDGEEVRGNPNPPPQCEIARGQYTNPAQANSDDDPQNDCIDPDSGSWPTPTPTPEVNLLADNDSFESGTYGFVVRSTGDSSHADELLVPLGWQFMTDDNWPVDGNPDLLYFYPEMQPQERLNLNECTDDLPENDAVCDLFHRDKIMKVFKGGAPIRFALFKNMPLGPGIYRFSVDFFADAVWGYSDSGQKEWAPEGHAELHLCVENGIYQHLDWQPVPIGQASSRFVEFVVPDSQNVILFAMFRNNHEINNNGWFLDHFTLQKIADAPPELVYTENDLRHNCRASMPGAHEN
ncbi:MAG: protein kinase [Anaerolineae bacterium]|nr:protein kinase [Anaerolineae bacterium]